MTKNISLFIACSRITKYNNNIPAHWLFSEKLLFPTTNLIITIYFWKWKF